MKPAAAAFTISTFCGIPVCAQILERVFSKLTPSGVLPVHHCDIVDARFHLPGASIRPLRRFSTHSAFMAQSTFFKIWKYVQVFSRMAHFCLRHREALIYTIEANTCALAIMLKRVLGKRVVIVYHQIEMDLPIYKSRLDRALFRYLRRHVRHLSLFLVPEVNRLRYFRRQMACPDLPSMVVPNTCNPRAAIEKRGDRVVFGHVGALGANHYARELLEVFREPGCEWELLLVGRVSDDVTSIIETARMTNVRVVSQVPHAELMNFYAEFDFGLILYRPIDINNWLCAPNKLYEMWSLGIPVVAPALKGLRGVFEKSFLGSTVNMDEPAELRGQLSELANARGSFDRKQIADYFREHLGMDQYVEALRQRLAQAAQ